MYLIFVDDTPEDLLHVQKCIPAGRFSSVEALAGPHELHMFLADIGTLKKEEPGLVMLDMAIGEDEEAGLKMLQTVRQKFPYMPVVMVSRSNLKQHIRESFEQGAASYILKPNRSQAFSDRIVEMLSYFSEVTKIPATAGTM